MACGTPAIVGAGVATDDFVDDATGYRVPSRRVELGRVVNGLELTSEGWWMEPDIEGLAEAMRAVYRDREAAAARGRAAAARARDGWTWRHAARVAAQRIDELAAGPVLPRTTVVDPLRTYRRAWFSRNGIDGMLLELFARVRFSDPAFIEIAADDARISNVKVLGRIYGWSGIIVTPSAPAAFTARAEYAAAPRIAPIAGDERIGELEDLVRDAGSATMFDLVSIEGSHRPDAAQLLAFRPRVVVIGTEVRDAAAIAAAVEERAAYVQLDAAPLAERLFVLREIAERAGFPYA